MSSFLSARTSVSIHSAPTVSALHPAVILTGTDNPLPLFLVASPCISIVTSCRNSYATVDQSEYLLLERTLCGQTLSGFSNGQDVP